MPRRAARGVRGRARGALRLPRPGRPVELVNVARHVRRPGAARRRRARPSARRGSPSRRRPCSTAARRGARAARRARAPARASRPGVVRAARGDAARRPRRGRRASTRPATIAPAKRPMSGASTRSSCRCRRRAARRLRGDGRRADPLGALLEHQGAPRRLDRAVRRRRARWSCRPSTSPCTSARCRPPSPPCSASATRPACRGSSTTPSGRHAPARHHRDHARLPRRRAALLGFAASRAHHADVGGARRPGSMPADSRTLEEEGVVISPRPLDDAAIDALAARDAPARAAACRPARPARRQPRRRRRLSELGAPARARAPARAAPTRCSTTPSGARAPAWPSWPTARARRATCSRRPRATSSCGCAPTVAGERLPLDFTGSAGQHAGNLNCPLAVTARPACSPCACSPTPTSRPAAGAYRPIEVLAPAGCLLNARPPARPSPRATSRRPPASPTWCSSAFGRALGQGTMNNLTLGQRATSPTTRRSAAGRARARTPTGRAACTSR